MKDLGSTDKVAAQPAGTSAVGAAPDRKLDEQGRPGMPGIPEPAEQPSSPAEARKSRGAIPNDLRAKANATKCAWCHDDPIIPCVICLANPGDASTYADTEPDRRLEGTCITCDLPVLEAQAALAERDQLRAEVAALRERLPVDGSHMPSIVDLLESERDALRERVSNLEAAFRGATARADEWIQHAATALERAKVAEAEVERLRTALIQWNEAQAAYDRCLGRADVPTRNRARDATDALRSLARDQRTAHPSGDVPVTPIEVVDRQELRRRYPEPKEEP